MPDDAGPTPDRETQTVGAGRDERETFERALDGTPFPAGKRELVERARANQADERVVRALENLPDTRFEDPTSVLRLHRQQERGMLEP